jgi:hypothetical protein
MPVYILRNGELVEKTSLEEARADRDPIFPRPNVSRFESYASPIDDSTISSHRQRDVDMYRSNSYDVRDTGPNHAFTRAKEARKADNGRSNPTQLDFWR